MSNDHDGTEEAWEVGDDTQAGADASSTPETDDGDATGAGSAELSGDADDADVDSGEVENDTVADDNDDEADDSDEADSGTELVGAGVAAGSARAAARRSAAVKAGITEKKGRATAGRDDNRDTRGNLFQRLLRFLREVVAELKKVIWPARKQMITYSIVVIVFVVFMVALVYGLDALFAQGVLSIFG
ncbi:preprotein translocase subunit SecE [Nakamurella lactea]|uniref:preprotein translocase subunit SecE n=1 Tax=Nakamurella lactea TaxID=459515 RepID=UPI000401BF9D|nr:preprotein translocase subunit SecE [Nakamurella lactea]